MEISESHGCNGNAGLVTKASDHVVETGVTKTKKCKEEHPVSQLQIDFLLAIASFFCRDFESERSPTRKFISRPRAKLEKSCQDQEQNWTQAATICILSLPTTLGIHGFL